VNIWAMDKKADVGSGPTINGFHQDPDAMT
jgi:hypothetical protein